MQKAILLGDSIRICYFPLVARQLETEFELWGPAENGGTSRHTLAMLPDWLADRAADVVHVNCGIHDVAIDPPAATNRVELAEYEENLRGIFTLLQGAEARIVWATTTPIMDDRYHASSGFERHEADVLRYNAAALEIAQSFGVAVDDLHAVVVNGGVEDCISADGVHMSDLGNHLLADAVAACLRKLA